MCTNLILFTVLSLLFSIEAKSIPNAQSEKVELNESTLKLLFVVAREGEVYPNNYMIKACPKYEYANHGFPPGELNENGRISMYQLGHKLRLMYPEFLHRRYITKNLLKATAVGNKYTISTREGALLTLKGLRNENMNKAINTRKWSAKRLSTTRNDEFTDAASGYYQSCPNFFKKQKIALKKELMPKEKNKRPADESTITDEDINSKTKNLINKLNENTGANITGDNLVALKYLADLYEATERSNLLLPKWYDEDMWISLHFLMRRYIEASVSTNDLRSLAGGRMVKYFFDKLDDKLAGRLEPCETKLLLHVGYERTVVPFFAALAGEDGFENKWVGLNTTKKSIRAFEGGMFVIEVHESKDSDDYWLRMIYSESLYAPISEVTKSECGHPCSFKKLKEITKATIDKDKWTKKCTESPKSIIKTKKTKVMKKSEM